MENSRESGNDAENFCGEPNERPQTFDWADTPLGAPETWSENLKNAVRAALETREPIFDASGRKSQRADESAEAKFAAANSGAFGQTEAERKFLFEITEKIRRSENAEDLLFDVAVAVGEHLQARRCLFNEIDIENDRETVHRDFCREVESVAGVHRISAYSSSTSAEIAAGKTVVNRDSKTDLRTAALYEKTYEPVGERAYVAVPLLRDNLWVASLWISDDVPRDWSGAEINLLEIVAERAWLAVEKLRSEKALRESEERFAKAFNSSPLAFTISSLTTGKLVEVNETFINVTGYSRAEAIGKTTVELGLWNNLSDRENELAAVTHEGKIRNREFLFRMKNGSTIIGLLSAELIEIGGEPCALTVIQDITERKQAEENREYQNRLLEALTESLLDGILIVSPEGKMLHFNQHFLDIWNFPAEVVESKSDALALQWAANQTTNPQAFLERVGNVYEQPNEQVREEVPMQDGRVYERFGAPILSGQSRLGWVWTFRDITTRKRAESNLSLLSEISQDLTRLTDADEIMQSVGAKVGAFLDLSHCNFVEISEHVDEAVIKYAWHRQDAPSAVGVYRLTDYVNDEFLSEARTGTIFVSRDTQTDSRIDAELHAALGMGSFVSLPQVRGGEWRFQIVAARSAPHDWSSQEIELLRELTVRIWTRLERARAEEELRDSEERYRTLFTSIDEGFCLIEMLYDDKGAPNDWRFLEVNPAFETQNGLKQATGKTVRELTPDIEARWFEIYGTVAATGEAIRLVEHSEALNRWFDLYAFRVGDQSERKVAVLFNDITPRKASEIEREKMLEREQELRREAEAANLLKDEFLATVSHELRTPLNAILGWAEMLKSGKATGETAVRANETIYRNAKSQAQLIEDLLDVSRIITGKMKLDSRPVQIALVVESAIETLRPAAGAKSIEIEINLGCEPCVVGGDEQRLQQMVWNLISNAVKFTGDGGKIEVTLENDGAYAGLTVKDTGKGIEAEFLPFLFERFRQQDASSTRRHGGLGLGLAIVRNLVELHGGTIFAESAGENLGAKFTIKLPLISAGDGSANGGRNLRESLSDGFSGANSGAKKMSGIRVLLVDDEKDTLEMLETALTSEGADVRTADSASEAFEILRDWQPDVLVSDIAMPEEDGYSLIKKTRELKPENGGLIPAIAMTAYVRVEDRMRVLASGFQMYVPKPAEPAELINAVINLIGKSELL